MTEVQWGAGGAVPPAGTGGLLLPGSGGLPAAGFAPTGGMWVGAPTGGIQGGAPGGFPIPGGGGAEPPAGGDYFDGANPGRNDVAAGNVCDRVATVQCAAEAFCCMAPGRTFEQCKAIAKGACVNEGYLDVMTADPKTGFDPARARAALEMFENMAKACDISVATWALSVEGLRGIMQGTLPTGADCTAPFTAALDPALGAPFLVACADPATTACLPASAASWTCEPRGGVGSTCFTDVNCEDGLYCPQTNPLQPTFGLSCAPRLQEGATCNAANECASLACRSGVCVAASQESAYCLE